MFVFCSCIYNKRLCKLGQVNFAVLVGVHGLDHRLDGLVTDGLVLVEKYDFACIGELLQINRSRMIVVDEIEESHHSFFVASEHFVYIFVFSAERVQYVTIVEGRVILNHLLFLIVLDKLVLVLEPGYFLDGQRFSQSVRPVAQAYIARVFRSSFLNSSRTSWWFV